MAQIDLRGHARVLVTGSTGFVGQALCARLEQLGHAVRRATRSAPGRPIHEGADTVAVGDLGADTDWSCALRDISLVIHLAARTHVLRETTRDAISAYRRVNVDGTRALANAALHSGVRRIVFVSSIKATGEGSDVRPLTERTPPQPEDAYGISKWEAEQALVATARNSPLEYVILRPPLVYGPGVKGNFLRLMHWVARRIPLPFQSIENRRSLIGVDNLVDAVIAAGTAPEAAHKTYLVSDGEDLSTPDLIRSIAAAMRVQPHLYPCPPSLLNAAAGVLGRRAEMRRLLSSLQIDSAKIRDELNWMPRTTLAQGLDRTAQWYYSLFPAKSNT